MDKTAEDKRKHKTSGGKSSSDKSSSDKSSGRKSSGQRTGRGSGTAAGKTQLRDLVYLATIEESAPKFIRFEADSPTAWVQGSCYPAPIKGDRLLTRMTDDSVQQFCFTGKKRKVRGEPQAWLAEVIALSGS
jgi:hypothetical protein